MKVVVNKKRTLETELRLDIERLQASLEEAERIISRDKETISDLHKELVEVNSKFHCLERAVKDQAACWMCKSNEACHPINIPKKSDVTCGKFEFNYELGRSRVTTANCHYKHGKSCWAQKCAPECSIIGCPLGVTE